MQEYRWLMFKIVDLSLIQDDLKLTIDNNKYCTIIDAHKTSNKEGHTMRSQTESIRNATINKLQQLIPSNRF